MSNLGKFDNLSNNFSNSFKDFANDKKIDKSEIEKLEKIKNKSSDDEKLLKLLKSNNDLSLTLNDTKYEITVDLKDKVNKKDYSKGNIPPTIFKSENEKGRAEKYLDMMSGNAFDPLRSTEDKFLNLKTIDDKALKGNISKLEINKSVPSIPLNNLKNVKTNEDFVNAVKNYISKNPKVLQELGNNPTDEQINQYILNNLDSIAQNLGDDIPYEGFTSFIGDSNGFLALQQGYGVCTDIHATITALRRAFGQESYLVMTTGSDAAHVFTIFKNNGKWHIQNYENVYKTSANTISELYDQVMPEQRKIKIYDVQADGNITQKTTEHLTATGLSERRFRAESGTGGFNPWTSPEGLTIGSGELSYAKNGFYIGVNPNDNTVRGGYYKKTQEGDTQKVQGASIQGQYFENQYGYEQKK